MPRRLYLEQELREAEGRVRASFAERIEASGLTFADVARMTGLAEERIEELLTREVELPMALVDRIHQALADSEHADG
jgi:cyanate lyase